MRSSVAVIGVVFLAVAFLALPAAAQVAGFFHGDAELDFDGGLLDALWLDITTGVEYSIDGWSFGVTFDAGNEGLADLAFLTTGLWGALHVYSMYGLWDVASGSMAADWDNAVWTQMFGVDLWGIFSVQTEYDNGAVPDLSGAGLSVGGHAAPGDLEMWWEVCFNSWQILPLIYWNGLDSVMDKNLACDFISVDAPTCALDFTYADFFFRFPFCCIDVQSWISFDCDGFDDLRVWVQDIPLGNSPFTLSTVALDFDLTGKQIDVDLGIDAGDVACITPYLTLNQDSEYSISGIYVEALQLVCTLGDATVTVSELLSPREHYVGQDGAIHTFTYDYYHWTFPSECVDPLFDVSEAISIEIGREGCCGGHSKLALYNFFDFESHDALFGWVGLRARAEASLTSTVSTYLETWYWVDGLESITFGIDISWGTLRSLPKDQDCCIGGAV
jgi:hypothetical protein